MAEVPDYSGLEAQWQVDCHNWNANITATNHRRPALSNPPTFLKLFNDGYDTYADLKADLDEATSSAGWLTVKQNSKPNHAILACSRGAQRLSTATITNASTIKVGCKWSAVAHTAKKTSNKWKLVVHEHRHTHHGPQEVPEAQRGWAKLSEAHLKFLTRAARDPANATPKRLETLLRQQYPTVKLGQNTLKNWLQGFRKDKQGIYTPSQAALDWLEKEGYWYRFTQDEKNNITGIFWCSQQQIAWLQERRFSHSVSLDCTYSTNNKKMPYFQGTALTHTKKILPLFQGVVDNERESGFRWLLEQVHLLLRHCEADDPTLFVTDYDNALINALESEFPHARHQLCVFHMNMNVVLHIKKKWRKPVGLTAAEADDDEAEDAEEEEETAEARLNAPARNTATIPKKVPDDVPYTRQALFDLLKFMEYSTDREVYETAWQRLQEKFSDQTAIINYLKTYYVDDDEKIVAKWAGHQTCKTLNFGLRTTSSTERMHRKIKVYLGHGLGHLFYLVEAVHKTIKDTAKELRLEEARQKTLLLQKFNGQKWLGRVSHQVSWPALELLASARQHALKMLQEKAPRGYCTALSCTCPIYTQYGLICANRMADREEADLPLEKTDVHEVYWLDRNLSLENPLLTVLSPNKVTATKGRPRETATFAADKEGVFQSSSSRGKAVMGKKTTSTTTSLGSKAGDKTRATTASVQRVNSAFEHNDSTLQSLDEEDTRSSGAQREAVRRDQRLVVGLTKQQKRQPQKRRAEGTASPAATPSSSRPAAKRQRTGARRTVNQLPCVDLTADDVDDDGEGGEGAKETQDEIVAVMPGFVDLLFD
jgi:hypothetical protein